MPPRKERKYPIKILKECEISNLNKNIKNEDTIDNGSIEFGWALKIEVLKSNKKYDESINRAFFHLDAYALSCTTLMKEWLFPFPEYFFIMLLL